MATKQLSIAIITWGIDLAYTFANKNEISNRFINHQTSLNWMSQENI